MRSTISISLLLLLVFDSIPAAVAEILPGLSSITESNIRDAAIAFVNMSTSPGLEGAILSIDNDMRESDQWRSSAGFNAEFTLKDYTFNGYWGLGLFGGRLEDRVRFVDDSGQDVQLNLTRDVVALSGSIGLSFPIDQNFKVRPFLTLVVSDLQSKSVLNSQYVIDNSLPSDTFKTRAQMWSSIATLDAVYSRWYGDYQLNMLGQYNLIYTESFSEDQPALDTEDWNDTVIAKVKLTGPTSLSSSGKPWRWNAYANYSNFLSHNKRSLGYQSLAEVGGGMDLQLNIKPLDWFGWEYIGFKVGLIFGDSVRGYSAGLTAR